MDTFLDLSQIQAAIRELPSKGTIEIPAGTRKGNLLLQKSLTIKGKGKVALRANKGSVIAVQGEELEIEIIGLEITGGLTDGGGGILVTGKKNRIIVRDCLIHANSASQIGGGIHIASGTLELDNCIIEDNHAALGGAVMLDGTAQAKITNSKISCNTAEQGAAFYLREGVDASLIECKIQENHLQSVLGRGEVAYIAGSTTRQPTLKIIRSSIQCTQPERCLEAGKYPGELSLESSSVPEGIKYYPGLQDKGKNKYQAFKISTPLKEALLNDEEIQAVLAFRAVRASGQKVMPPLEIVLKKLAAKGLARVVPDGSLQPVDGVEELVTISRGDSKTIMIIYRDYTTDVPVKENRFDFHLNDGKRLVEHQRSIRGEHFLQFIPLSKLAGRIQKAMQLRSDQQPYTPKTKFILPFIVLQGLYNSLPNIRPALENSNLKKVDADKIARVTSQVTSTVIVGIKTKPGEPTLACGIVNTPSGSLLSSFSANGGTDLELRSAGYKEIWPIVEALYR